MHKYLLLFNSCAEAATWGDCKITIKIEFQIFQPAHVLETKCLHDFFVPETHLRNCYNKNSKN